MAHTVSQLAAELARYLPAYFSATEPLQVALAAPMQLVEQAAEDFAAATLLANSDDIWLTFLARGYGLERATLESDASLRARLRHIGKVVTPEAILEITAQLAGAAGMVEWFEGPFLDNYEGGFFLDSSFPSGGRNTFLLFVPEVGTVAVGDSYLDVDFWLDSDGFLGADDEDPIYATIVAEIEQIRAQGIRWALVIGFAVPT